VEATASAGGDTLKARDTASTSALWCAVRLNDTPMGDDLQAAVDASTQATDVVKVGGYCRVHDLNLNKTLTLQGAGVTTSGFGLRMCTQRPWMRSGWDA